MIETLQKPNILLRPKVAGVPGGTIELMLTLDTVTVAPAKYAVPLTDALPWKPPDGCNV